MKMLIRGVLLLWYYIPNIKSESKDLILEHITAMLQSTQVIWEELLFLNVIPESRDYVLKHMLLLLLNRVSLSDSVRPHRRQPNRLLCPWDSPGKNIGVGCHFLLQCIKVKSESEGVQSCLTLSDPMDCSPPGSSIHGIFQARVLEWVAIAFSESICQHIKNQFFLSFN